MRFEYYTNRLALRVLPPDHAQLVLDFYIKNHDFLMPFEPEKHPGFLSLEFQKSNLSYEYSSFLKSKYLRLWIFEKEHPETAIGTICFSNVLHGAFCSAMVGYKMDQDYLRKGYMSEALAFLLPLVCNDFRLHRIEAYVLPDNAASITLLENLAFTREGLLHDFARINGTWRDHYLYSWLA